MPVNSPSQARYQMEIEAVAQQLGANPTLGLELAEVTQGRFDHQPPAWYQDCHPCSKC